MSQDDGYIRMTAQEFELRLAEVRANERERCAEIAMKFLNLMDKGFVVTESNLKQAEAVAKAIRQQEASK